MADIPSIAILDAGSQYGKLIDKYIRGFGVCTELYPLETPPAELSHVQGIVISGGPESVYEPKSPRCNSETFDLGIPVLGICYGMQLAADILGGNVSKLNIRQDGQTHIQIDPQSRLFQGLHQDQQVLLTHGDIVTQVPPGFRAIAWNDHTGIVGMESEKGAIFGVQFHPEVTLTNKGRDMLSRFVWDICECSPNYYPADRLQEVKDQLAHEIGDRHVIALLSGGVDSTVAVRLVSEVVPAEKIHAIHVDNGFMRHKESELVVNSLKILGMDIHHLNASDQFLQGTTTKHGISIGPLQSVVCPEQKRAIIGDVFMQLVNQEVARIGLPVEQMVLLQGTLRPDLIESASEQVSKTAQVIKTHHNDTELVRTLREQGRVVEPLKDFHKDEVRELGRLLELPHKLIHRQPFPGPGLAIRILCSNGSVEVSWQELVSLNQDQTIQILPIRSVGVQGDGRGYKWVAAIKEYSWETVYDQAQTLIRHMHGIGRVVTILTQSGTDVHLTETYLSQSNADLLRQADWIVRDVFEEYDCYRVFAQIPVILIPISFGEPGGRSIVIRPFITTDFMTGTPGKVGQDIPRRAVHDMAQRLMNLSGITGVLYDVTGKPPGTTEWE